MTIEVEHKFRVQIYALYTMKAFAGCRTCIFLQLRPQELTVCSDTTQVGDELTAGVQSCNRNKSLTRLGWRYETTPGDFQVIPSP